MRNDVLAVLVAFLGYSIVDVAKAVQKVGLERARSNRLSGTLIWLAATASTTISSFLLLYAVSLGSVLIVGAMGGTGLAALTAFSIIIMKEHASKREIAGVVLILLGPVAMATFSRGASNTPTMKTLYIFMSALLFAYLIALIISLRTHKRRGIVIAGIAGALSGFVLLLQKVSTTETGRGIAWVHWLSSELEVHLLERILQVLVNPYAVAWVATSIASTLVLQFAYRHDRAIRIVPTFGANQILVPIVGGLLSFHEALHPVQWAGIGLILLGVGLVSVRPHGTSAVTLDAGAETPERTAETAATQSSGEVI